jgi:hypothetical protein
VQSRQALLKQHRFAAPHSLRTRQRLSRELMPPACLASGKPRESGRGCGSRDAARESRSGEKGARSSLRAAKEMRPAIERLRAYARRRAQADATAAGAW